MKTFGKIFSSRFRLVHRRCFQIEKWEESSRANISMRMNRSTSRTTCGQCYRVERQWWWSISPFCTLFGVVNEFSSNVFERWKWTEGERIDEERRGEQRRPTFSFSTSPILFVVVSKSESNNWNDVGSNVNERREMTRWNWLKRTRGRRHRRRRAKTSSDSQRGKCGKGRFSSGIDFVVEMVEKAWTFQHMFLVKSKIKEKSRHWSRREKCHGVDPWGPYHFLGKNFPEQSRYVETIKHYWKTFLVIKLDSPSSGKIRVLEPYLGTCNFVVKSYRKVCWTSQPPYEGYFSCNITSWRIN